MNNIEMESLKGDLIKYLGYTDDEMNSLYSMNEVKLSKLKMNINKIKNDEYKANQENVRRKIETIFNRNPTLLRHRILQNNINIKKWESGGVQTVKVDPNRKPKILFITDVKGWAWWIKSEYLKKYLSDDFDIDIMNVIQDNGRTNYNRVDQKKYDLYFSYGFSYINFLNKVPKHKKITGVTAHRARNVIFPMMKIAGHHHANSIMLLTELQNMGFKKAYYVPNGVDTDLFKPIKPIEPKTELVVGHVGKETSLKGQREFILPAIKMTGCKSATNLRTWKDKLPHTEMPKIYNEMDVFMVASVEDGTPNPALEAAACGRPIISNRIGNMPELIKDGWNGFLVERKIGAYVEKINYFKENPEELVRMGNNARKSIEEEWTWEIQAERYRNMFKDIFGMES